MSVITAARLVPIGKSSGSPIAVGDTFRRLAGKLLMDSVVARVTDHLKPEQIGVQVANAAGPMLPKQPRGKCAHGHGMRSRTKFCCRWTCATPLERQIDTRCSQKSKPIAPPFSPMPPRVIATPTSCWGMVTLWNPRTSPNRPPNVPRMTAKRHQNGPQTCPK